jgi:hypothetical protein
MHVPARKPGWFPNGLGVVNRTGYSFLGFKGTIEDSR